MGVLFGTDGVRGIANQDLTGEIAYKLGRAGAYFLTNNYQGKDKAKIIIGKDTRLSGDMLEAALVAGITSIGVDVIKVGIIPTPGVAYLTTKLGLQGGVMISASHNPIADNGIKFFDQKGFKLSDEMEDKIEDIIFNKYEQLPYPTHTKIGGIECAYNYIEDYINYLASTVDSDLSNFKIVIDCANGAAYQAAPMVLKALGADPIVINNEADGEKINVNCGSTYPDIVKDKVLEVGADIGITHDGDADRIILVTREGKIVDGDGIMAIAALDMLKKGQLKKKTLVTTAYSNLGLKEVIEAHGAQLIMAQNGDRYVLQEMLNNGYNLGGEKSGHIIFLDYNTTGDGILAAMQILDIMKKTNKSLAELADVVKPWPQRLKNIKVKDKDWEKNKAVQKEIKKAKTELGEKGRIFVRASGTEPLIRVMLEGKEEVLLIKLEENVSKVIEEELN